MLAAPTASSHQVPLAATRPSPADPATPKAAKAARLTPEGEAAPDPVSRNGPIRSSSVPRIPSE